MNVLMAVTGSIAAYKAPSIASILVNKGHSVKIMMTKAAEQFITTLSLSTMSKNPVYTEDIQFANDGHIHHIELAQWADIIVVVPATYNTISKINQKIADNIVTSTIAALPQNKRILIFPAMNVHMWNNLEYTILDNYDFFTKRNITIHKPASGKQACGDTGPGKLLPTKEIIEHIEAAT